MVDLAGGLGILLPSLTHVHPQLTGLAALGCTLLRSSRSASTSGVTRLPKRRSTGSCWPSLRMCCGAGGSARDLQNRYRSSILRKLAVRVDWTARSFVPLDDLVILSDQRSQSKPTPCRPHFPASLPCHSLWPCCSRLQFRLLGRELAGMVRPGLATGEGAEIVSMASA